MPVTEEQLEGREQQGARIKGAELGLEDFPEDGDQVPEGLVLPAPSGWVSVGLAQEGRPLCRVATRVSWSPLSGIPVTDFLIDKCYSFQTLHGSAHLSGDRVTSDICQAPRNRLVVTQAQYGVTLLHSFQ